MTILLSRKSRLALHYARIVLKAPRRANSPTVGQQRKVRSGQGRHKIRICARKLAYCRQQRSFSVLTTDSQCTASRSRARAQTAARRLCDRQHRMMGLSVRYSLMESHRGCLWVAYNEMCRVTVDFTVRVAQNEVP